jgi:hypothetical protein
MIEKRWRELKQALPIRSYTGAESLSVSGYKGNKDILIIEKFCGSLR